MSLRIQDFVYRTIIFCESGKNKINLIMIFKNPFLILIIFDFFSLFLTIFKN